MPDSPVPEPAPTRSRLSALEQALRDALGELPREQVVRCVAGLIPIDAVVEAAAPPHGGKVRKVSVSMPEELVEAVRARTGSGGFSRYVTDAVAGQIRLDLLDDLSAELQAEFGPFDEAMVEEAMKLWHGSDE